MPHTTLRLLRLYIDPCRRGGAAVLLLALVLVPAVAWPADRSQPLEELLQSIARSGVQLIYSSETIPPGLRTTPPPSDLPVEERLKRLLAPLHLEAQKLPTGGYVIVHSHQITVALEIAVTMERDGVVSPLPGADVSLLKAQRHGLTDQSGRVTFLDLTPGDYPVVVKSDGSRAVHRTVRVAAGGAAARIDVRILWESLSPEEIWIEGNRYDAGATLGLSAARETLVSTPITSNDAVRSLQLLPGTAVAGYSAKTHVRGSRDDETLVRYDGLTLTDPYHLESLQSLNSAIDPAVMEAATSWTGVAPIQFGGRIGAVVDVVPRTITHGTIDAELSNRDVRVLVGIPFDNARGTVFASARLSNASSPARWLEPASLSPDYRDYTLRATWQVAPRTRMVAGALIIDDVLNFISSESEPADQRAQLSANENYSWLKLVHDFLPWVRSETLVSYELAEGTLQGGIYSPGIEVGFMDKSDHDSALTVSEELTIVPAQKWALQIGIERTEANIEDTLSKRVTFSPPFVPGLQPSAQVQQNSNVSLNTVVQSFYSAIQWQSSDGTLVDVGARHDGRRFDSGATSDGHWSLRGNLRQRLSESTVLRLGWGQTTQASVFDFTRAADGSAQPAPARELTQVELSVEQELNGHWFLRTTIYDKRERSPFETYENVFTPFALLQEIDVGTQLVVTQRAHMRGLEAQLESDRSAPLSGWLSYAWSTAKDDIAGQWVPRTWDQPHAVQLGTRWRRGPWQVTGLFAWHTGWPYTPLVASTTTWQNPDLVSFTLAPRNSARRQNFASLDLRASWEHSLWGGLFQAALELNDVTNSKTVCCQSYAVAQWPDGSSHLINSQDYWLGFSTLFSIRWQR